MCRALTSSKESPGLPYISQPCANLAPVRGVGNLVYRQLRARALAFGAFAAIQREWSKLNPLGVYKHHECWS